MKKSLIRLKALQIVVDAILILAAFALAYFIRVGFILSTDFPFPRYALIALITLPITLGLMFFARSYRLTQQALSLRHFQRIAYVSIQNVAVFMVLYYFAYRNFFSRLILVYIFAFTLALVYGWHLLFQWILKRNFQREVGVYRTLVIGANRPAEDIVGLLIGQRSHLKPVAVINAHGGQKTHLHGVPVVGKMDRFERAVAENNIDVILQADHLEQSLNIINYALANHLLYVMPPELLGVFQGHQRVEEVEGVPLLKVEKRRRWWHDVW